MLLTGLLCGILLGFVMQRGRFYITGAFRDLYVTKNNKMFIALLLAITVQSIGFFWLKEIGVLNVEPAENFAFFGRDYGGICIWYRYCTGRRLCHRNLVSRSRRINWQLGGFIHVYVTERDNENGAIG